MSLPIVAIVGRPNVGKSSLLNTLAGRRISIVDATPGVTRDRVSTPIELGSGFIELVDTGGMGIEDVDDLTDDVEDQIASGVSQAALILFMVDAREGVSPLDSHVARLLRKQEKPVILLANKVDMMNTTGEIGELHKLGFGAPMLISATHSRGIGDMLDEVQRRLGDNVGESAPPEMMKLAIVGKRNAGKSTFINSLVGQERVIVSDVPGTTRDSVDVLCEIDGQEFMLIDTAGVRKRSKIDGNIEFYAHHRAMRSIRRADVVAMMIDASLPISQVDKKLAGLIAEQFKPVVLVVNKWDLAKDRTTGEEYVEYFEKVMPELKFAPVSLTSATEGQNLEGTIRLASQLFEQANMRVSTADLNKHIEEILAMRGPSHKAGTKRPKILYASQIGTAPPTIVCFVNDVRSFDQSYQRFLVNQLRERLPFDEIPIRLLLRKRRQVDRKPVEDNLESDE
jgi:GTPase